MESKGWPYRWKVLFLTTAFFFAMLAAVTSVKKETLGSFKTVCVNTAGVQVLEYGSDKDLTYFSTGSPFNGIVVGRNKYGFYGRVACFGGTKNWGSWL